MYKTKEFVILAAATLSMILEYYSVLSPDPVLFVLSVFVYFFLLPATVLLALGEDVRAFGLMPPKKWPFGFGKTVLVVLALLFSVYLMFLFPEYREYYLAKFPTGLPWPFTLLSLFVLYFSEEFFFRGYLLFGLEGRFGAFANVFQTVLFTLFHAGKPPVEVLLSFFVGLLFGHIAFASRSFLPGFLIHTSMGILLFILLS